MARKSPREATASEDGFTPLLEGVYATGGEINGRLQILREGKLAEYEASGEIEVMRQA
jgi:hypothetical protein